MAATGAAALQIGSADGLRSLLPDAERWNQERIDDHPGVRRSTGGISTAAAQKSGYVAAAGIDKLFVRIAGGLCLSTQVFCLLFE